MPMIEKKAPQFTVGILFFGSSDAADGRCSLYLVELEEIIPTAASCDGKSNNKSARNVLFHELCRRFVEKPVNGELRMKDGNWQHEP
ncbi:hypothetical protein AKJ16_DCAP20539 [Drosera capensis]